jgi:tRNA A-37 threonylcarbamoyl transferase component Bud32
VATAAWSRQILVKSQSNLTYRLQYHWLAIICGQRAGHLDDDEVVLKFSATGSVNRDAKRQALLDAVVGSVLSRDAEFKHLAAPTARREEGQADYLFAVGDEPHGSDDIFGKLRWGGQFVYVSRYGKQLAEAATQFKERGFDLIRGPGFIRQGWPIPFLGRKTHYFVARKVQLTLPREFSDRFTYHVQLVEPDRAGAPCHVLKEVPSTDRVAARLRKRFPDIAEEIILKRSRKFTEKIFPLFLTREAAMLQILERDLPARYAGKVPRLLDMETDSRGYVRRLKMNWLRNGGKPLPQLEFARQCTELLHVLHDVVGVIHLDLRLDNIVITERGVGFVDFGSAVRVGENLAANPLLETLYEELMRTSEIQRMLSRMTLSGNVTSPIIQNGYQKVDKSVDFFYLALQVNDPLKNPDFKGLVQFDPTSKEAAAIKKMTDEVLRPRDLKNPRFRSAGDMLHGIQMIADGDEDSLAPLGAGV